MNFQQPYYEPAYNSYTQNYPLNAQNMSNIPQNQSHWQSVGQTSFHPEATFAGSTIPRYSQSPSQHPIQLNQTIESQNMHTYDPIPTQNVRF